ncbi:hypothetical protein RISK_006560 [Rhodopirellula islandica]|uniref:Uncharacterized protein n=1 Tax=Rhodopirellula islandica TaxID=595434 RepID=A0A0J1E7G9_RHOIS|nr:hypothetical protein RISK_006560 [Rhodopirellula islandica]
MLWAAAFDQWHGVSSWAGSMNGVCVSRFAITFALWHP